ncbi:MAG TPA: DUF3011 domain-containing protein [Rhodanobacteraceae bacterium]|nr:DUF3011 domain-containing protein [Rhodanobacteraceae bacterium]
MRSVPVVLAGFAWMFAAAATAQVTYSNRPPPPGYTGNPGQVVACGSPQYHLARCPVPPGWRGARLVRQTSDSACVEGRTWGFDRGSIWVNEGCGGEFAAVGGWRPGPGWDRDFVVSCGSPQYRRNFCQVDVGARGHVRLQRQLSDSACIEGRSWGWNRAGIWVDQGCGASFLVTRRW